jgi:hypothetical protein
MSRGGYRPGAGRPRKPLADKILEGNPGKRELKKVGLETGKEKASKKSNSKPKTAKRKPKKAKNVEFLENSKDCGISVPTVSEVYKSFSEWLDEIKCKDFVAPNLIEDFAINRSAYFECEYQCRAKGRVVRGKRSPYVQFAIDYNKRAMAIYSEIWRVISENSEKPLNNEGFMDMLDE